MEMVIKYWKEEEGYDTVVNDHGFCAYYFDSDTGEFFCGHVYIDNSVRGKGYGRELFEEMRKIAIELGATHFTGNLWKTKANKDRFPLKLKIFKQLGFKIIEDAEFVTTVTRPVKDL